MNETAQRVRALNDDLMDEARTSRDYVLLIVTSCVLATLGLLTNSTAVIIGAMIIAPLMLPIRGLAFGALQADIRLFRLSGTALGWGVLLALGLSWALGIGFPAPEFGSEVASRTQPNLMDLGVALTAGVVSAYAKLRPRISDTVAGTAIAVALMPPLCVVGLCLAKGFWAEAGGAFLLFLTNLLGIALACMVVFSLAGFATSHRRTWQALRGTLALTLILLLPLGYSFAHLVRQATLEATLKRLLVSKTVTVGQHAQLLSTHINWNRPVPEVYLYVRSSQLPTPTQVRLLEDFLEREMGRRFQLIFEVSRLREVRAENAPPRPEGELGAPAQP